MKLKAVDHAVLPLTIAEDGKQRFFTWIVVDAIDGTPGDYITREMLAEAVKEDLPSDYNRPASLPEAEAYLNAMGYEVDDRLLRR
jgi:hypothetical protein